MQVKFDMFDELLPELKKETAQKLATPDLGRFTQVSKSCAALFQPLMSLRQFLHYVTRGEHDLVQSMLKQDISLIFARDIVSDCSKREFENISGFEYALWALDKHMWTAMIACIPSNDEGRKVFAQLSAQCHHVTTNGITYRLNGEKITEKHFDFVNILIKQLHLQHYLTTLPGDKDWDAINKQWKQGVGGAQKLLPMHVVAEYCSDQPFNSMEQFTSPPKSSKKFYNPTTSQYVDWFADSKLSVDFALFKGPCVNNLVCAKEVHNATLVMFAGGILYDWNAMVKLYTARTNDFTKLKTQLKDQMTQNNQHHMSQIKPN